MPAKRSVRPAPSLPDARGPAPLVISDGPGGLGGREAGRAAGAFETPWFSRMLLVKGSLANSLYTTPGRYQSTTRVRRDAPTSPAVLAEAFAGRTTKYGE